MILRDLAMKTVRAVVDACSRDPELRSRVMADPKAALAEEGVELPFDKVEAIEDTPETTHVALTDPNAELSDEQMEAVVGGIGIGGTPGREFYRRVWEMSRAAGGASGQFKEHHILRPRWL